MEANFDELVAIECTNQGQPPKFLGNTVRSAIECFRHYARMADKVFGVSADVVTAGAPMHAYTRKEPVGVAALITPWNLPLMMAAWKLGPMLASGCSGVLKPAEQTSLSALRLGQLMIEAGVPAGVINIVTGLGHEAGDDSPATRTWTSSPSPAPPRSASSGRSGPQSQAAHARTRR